MGLAFTYIQQIFRETAQLMRTLDTLMGKDWQFTFGNRTTRDVTSHIDDPEWWLPEASFRIYDSIKEPSIKKGITIQYWHKDLDQPILIGGKLVYHLDSKSKKPKNQQHWDLWGAWFERGIEDPRIDGSVYKVEYEQEGDYIEASEVFALPLTSITSENAIKTKVYDKLISL
jgi:hypothetical protein